MSSWRSASARFFALAITLGFAACVADSATNVAQPEPTNPTLSPTAAPLITSKGRQGSTQILANDPDEGGTHRFAVSVDGAHGKAYLGAGGMVVYIPEPDYAGVDKFEVVVENSQGVTGTTWVSAVVRLYPLDPSATADLVTYKNTPGAYVVFPPSGVASAFQIAGVPPHGSAAIDETGFLTYTPDEGYSGSDAVDVQISLMNGDTTGVTVSVQVMNRPPVPAAEGIHAESGKPGVGIVRAYDPDPRETIRYQIVEAPAFGSATVDANGLVTYQPGQVWGRDRLVVQVEDGSGAAATTAVEVTVRLPVSGAGFTSEGGFLEKLCNDGLERVLISKIEPPPGTTGKEVKTVTATIAYSLATTTAVGLENETGTPVTMVTVAPGCGFVTVSADLGAAARKILRPRPYVGQQTIDYPDTGLGNLKPVGFFSAEDLGSAILDIYVSFEETMDSIFQTITFTSGGKSTNRTAFIARTNPILRLTAPNRCDQAYNQLNYQIDGYGGKTVDGTVGAVNTPPRVSIDTLLTGIPLTEGKTYTLNVELESCGAPVTVTLSTEPWVSLSETTVTLNPSAGVTVVVDADWLPVGDELIEGVLRVHPVDSSFADILVPVSAIRLDSIDLDDYEFTPIVKVPPNFWDYVKLTLPWPFPFEGVTHPTITVSKDGELCGNPVGVECMVSPPIIGGIVKFPSWPSKTMHAAPFWSPQQYPHAVAGENESGFYVREVVTGANPRVELLWWDLQTGISQNHNVYRVILYPDGRFSFDYPSVQPTGLELANWWGISLAPSFERVGFDIRSGDKYQFGPVD